jgi:RNA methyltransferase, TrmH family
MLSKADIKYIKSLQIKKYRKQEQRFTVEGAKSVQELLNSDFLVYQVIGTSGFLSNIKPGKTTELIEVSEKVLEGLGEFQSNNTVVAVAGMKPNQSFDLPSPEFALVLDDIRDPGNLGTIIRTADWYGINHIIASEETADFYNPKVISATMGSFTRMAIFYTSLPEFLSKAKVKVFGAFLDGRNVHDVRFDSGGLIVIGNESRGISPDVEKFLTERITIPRFGKAESLNAAIATAVICDNIRRSSTSR